MNAKNSHVELTPVLIEAISCYVTFIAMGFKHPTLQTVVTPQGIGFLFVFEDEKFFFHAVDLPNDSDAHQVFKSWRPALELWNTLSGDEARLMISMSKALQSVPPFLELLSKMGHLPAFGGDGAANNEFEAPCPFCSSVLHCRYHPDQPVIEHEKPPCLDFLWKGGTAALDELNRRGLLRMSGMVSEAPLESPEPS
jgi:hypothetical protein